MQATLKFTIDINTSAENLWKVLTDPEIVPHYMYGTIPETTWKSGDEIRWNAIQDGKTITYVNGFIKKVDEPVNLNYTVFPTMSELENVPENHLMIENIIEKKSDKLCQLTIIASDFTKVADGEKRYNDSINGWEATLPKIKELAEKL